MDNLWGIVDTMAPRFKPYLQTRIEPLIREYVNLPGRLRHIEKQWSNNNAESMNNILKIGTNHKLEDLTTLIETIQTIVNSMYKDVEKALVSVGNLKLSRNFEHHCLSVDVWVNKTKEERNTLLNKFYRDKGRSNTVTSTNGWLTLPNTPSAGKKPHQRRRRAAERATNHK
jgi:hypothetical protein